MGEAVLDLLDLLGDHGVIFLFSGVSLYAVKYTRRQKENS
jgi:hypothetical protein